jgi:hypothetical protein
MATGKQYYTLGIGHPHTETADEGSPSVFVTASDGVQSMVDPAGNLYPVAGANQFTADDTGSAWVRCPEVLSFSALLVSGTATVLLEVRDIAGTVTTAATIVNDVVAQTLRQAFITQEVQDFRFRRSSGTGVVTITY